jgi:hypothetical protein
MVAMIGPTRTWMKARWTWLARLAVAATSVTTLGCGSESQSPTLDTAAPTGVVESDEERLRKEQMLSMRIFDKSTGEYRLTSDEGYKAIERHCMAAAPHYVELPSTIYCWYEEEGDPEEIEGSEGCQRRVCRSSVDLCRAQLEAKLATEPGTVLDFEDVRIEPQTVAVNSEILAKASRNARRAVGMAAGVLDQAMQGWTPMHGGDCTDYLDVSVSAVSGPSLTLGEVISKNYIDGALLSETLEQKRVDAILATADAELSSSLSQTLALQRSFSSSLLSRAHAVSSLVRHSSSYPTDNGLKGLPGGSLCSSPELTSQASRALEILRQAAPPPTDVLGSTSTTSFLNSNRSSGSIKERLAQFWGRTFTTTLEEELQLSTDDFTEAREYLKNELTLFARSTTQTFQDSNADNYRRYPSTASAPSERDASYWAATGRYDSIREGFVLVEPSQYGDPDDYWPKNNLYSTSGTPHLGLYQEDNPEFRYSVAKFAQKVATNIALLPSAVSHIADRFALLSSTLTPHTIGYGVFDVTPTQTSFKMRMDGYTFDENNPVRLMLGEDGLHCATQGAIEGVPCTAVQLNAHTICYPDIGEDSHWASCDFPITPDASKRFYVVRLRPTATFSNALGGGSVPGSYESMLGASVYVRPQSSNPYAETAEYRKTFAFAPEVERQIAKLLTPNKDFCQRPRMSCAGASFDERVPLENELSSDGDAVESSWRNYLSLAKAAATEADALGTAYITAQLENDLRQETVEMREEARRQDIETALAEFQDLCGTNADPIQLLHLLSGTEDGTDLSTLRQKDEDGNHVTCSNDNQCDDGFSCSSGLCLKDPLDPASLTTDDPELKRALARINECIGGDTEASYATLGDTPLCIWHKAGIPTELCEKADRDHPCPVRATQSGSTWHCDDVELPEGLNEQNTDIVPVNTTLNYFVNTTTTPPVPKLCDHLRAARLQPDTQAAAANLSLIKASDIFHPYNLEPLASEIGWTAYLGGGAAVTLGGQTLYGPRDAVFTTGKLGWCEDCNDCNGLQGSECEALRRDNWAKLDDRVLRAVVALRGMTVGHLRDVYMPFYMQDTVDESSWRVRTLSDWTDVYPGTVTPMTVARLGSEWFADKTDYRNPDFSVTPVMYRFRIDSTATLPVAWRAPGVDGETMVEFPPIKIDGAKRYEVAIGETGRFNDFPQDDFYDVAHFCGDGNRGGISYTCPIDRTFADGRRSFWGKLSSANVRKVFGGVYDQFFPSQSDGAPPPSFYGPPTYLPGAPFGSFNTYDNGLFVGSWDCSAPVQRAGCAYPAQSMLPPFHYDKQNMLDAAELACVVTRDVDDFQCDVGNPPTIQHPRDYQKAKSFVGCLGDEIQRRAAHTVLYSLPERAIDALREISATGSFPQLGGTLGEDVARLRGALVEVSSIQDKVGYHIRSIGNDFGLLSTALEKSEIRSEIADLEFKAAANQQMLACNQAVLGAASVSTSAGVGGAAFASTGSGVSAAYTCANSFAQVRFTGELRNLSKQDAKLDQQTSITEFRQRFEDRAETLAGLATELGFQLEEIDARLASIEAAKNRAKRALGRALYKASSAAAQEATISSVYGNSAAVALERYSRANQNAVRLAFLAKRAIETRLGVKLYNLQSDMPLVEAPAKWEATLCASTGVDYNAFKESTESLDAGSVADQFIGEYVRKLEGVVESYRLANDFHEGEDTSVVSLRDDVFNVRTACAIPSANLITHSGQLDQQGIAARVDAEGQELPAVPGWNCSAGTDCVSVKPRADIVPPEEFLSDDELKRSKLYELRFEGPGELVQELELEPGRYVLSWYSPVGAGNCSPSPRVKLFHGAQELTATNQTAVGAYCATGTGPRQRHSLTFQLDEFMTARLSLSAYGTETSTPHFIAAPQLELLDEGGASSYQNTTQVRTRSAIECGDPTGAAFRNLSWRRRCLLLCDNGYAETCAGGGYEECFREATFAINQRNLESGDVFKYAGFAKGNFNYRLSDVSVNFTGTGILSCEQSDSPLSCHGSGNLQYSLIHSGPYFVRNHEGEDARLFLYEGHIDHARGLAAERYFGNPIGGDDASLLDQYLRTEFRGRPLDGNFTLRVWEKPGVNFDRIEDVQLVLKYRYWTRFN